MKKKHPQPLTPAALYARGASDRQDRLNGPAVFRR